MSAGLLWQVSSTAGDLERAMVDALGGRHLVTAGGAWVEAETVLQNKVVALYFAAARCAPSRDFTPLLRDFYVELVEQALPPAPLAVVLVSADRSAREMEDFMSQLPGGWLALPFYDPYRQDPILRGAAVPDVLLKGWTLDAEAASGSRGLRSSRIPAPRHPPKARQALPPQGFTVLKLPDEGNQITVDVKPFKLTMGIRRRFSSGVLS
ncbi:PREDICTED: nucleoredoxin-like protein 2 isoform X3 [Hipposideros armiger]|uniref:Nucleoredoxin-like protein 2 isoform X3 n=1 Tax=Hipposideros armiger TaxID=186990 RepID=A0A8B7QFX5_HIPAR|nr:PREDICTED: nucleoredoxin-like protein 2 isoform X3 [Hipposideros armiger]